MEGSIPQIDDLQALFILYCAAGRTQRVVLGSTDGLYGVRLQSAKDIDTMTDKGFERMVKDMPGLIAHPRGVAIPVKYIFTNNVGVTKIAMSSGGTNRKSERFELPFDHWLDALRDLATHVFAKDIPPRTGVDPNDVALAMLLSKHMRPLISKRFLGTDQVGPDASLDDTQAASMGLSSSQVAEAYDWASANGQLGRPLTQRLVLTKDSVKTDAEAVMSGLRGVPLSFREARDSTRYAMRLRAKLSSFAPGEHTVPLSAGAFGHGSGSVMGEGGVEDYTGINGRMGASAVSSSVQLSLSPSLAREMAPSTRDKVHALGSLTSAEPSPNANRMLGPATAAALARGSGPSPLARQASAAAMLSSPLSRQPSSFGLLGPQASAAVSAARGAVSSGFPLNTGGTMSTTDPAALAMVAELTSNLQKLLATLGSSSPGQGNSNSAQ